MERILASSSVEERLGLRSAFAGWVVGVIGSSLDRLRAGVRGRPVDMVVVLVDARPDAMLLYHTSHVVDNASNI